MEGISTGLSIFLTVAGASAAAAFYKAAFGAAELQCHPMSGGRLSYKLAIGGNVFYIGDEEPEFGNLRPGNAEAASSRIILETRNADVMYENALRNGAVAICPMTTEDDWRIGKLRDPFGHVWEIGYQL